MKIGQLWRQFLKKFSRTRAKEKKEENIKSYIFVPIYIKGLDDDKNYLQRFDIEGLESRKLSLLHESHKFDIEKWSIKGNASHLWLFNMQYMEYLIPMALKFKETSEERYYEIIKRIITSWINKFDKRGGDAWEPYVISMRIPNWLTLIDILRERIVIDTEFIDQIMKSIFGQYKYLENHLEKHLLGNHYFENLKCILICSIIFQEGRSTERYYKMLCEQIREQILTDGMHFERSFMYHKIIIEDILRLVICLKDNKKHIEKVSYLTSVLKKMCDCLSSFEGEIGRTLMFNDAGDNVAKPTSALLQAVICNTNIDELKDNINELPSAGYYKYQRGKNIIIIDCGEIGPRYIPGHGQCDCLSYELFSEGKPWIVNSGTYGYQGKLRDFFRSTQAHTTFLVDDVQQSQCWGEHRVAKRISKICVKRERDWFLGQCNYWNGTCVTRKIEFFHNCMIVNDSSDKTKRIESFIHLSPEIDILNENKVSVYLLDKENHKRFNITVLIGEIKNISNEYPIGCYAPEFGLLLNKRVIIIKNSGLVRYKIAW